MKKFGGIITIYSDIGKGTVFNIYLPCQDENGQKREYHSPVVKKGSESVVIIDDEPLVATTLQILLKNLGYKVKLFTDGMEAIEVIRSAPEEVDVIISDYLMPQITGLEIAEKLKTHGIHIPIVIISGYFEKQVEDKARDLGIVEIITKPINSYQITDAIRRILQ